MSAVSTPAVEAVSQPGTSPSETPDAPAAVAALTLLGGAGVVCEGDFCDVPGAVLL